MLQKPSSRSNLYGAWRSVGQPLQLQRLIDFMGLQSARAAEHALPYPVWSSSQLNQSGRVPLPWSEALRGLEAARRGGRALESALRRRHTEGTSTDAGTGMTVK